MNNADCIARYCRQQVRYILTIVDNLKNDIVQNIRLQNTLDIEPIEADSEDFLAIQTIKNENNTKYSLAEAKAKLGL